MLSSLCDIGLPGEPGSFHFSVSFVSIHALKRPFVCHTPFILLPKYSALVTKSETSGASDRYDRTIPVDLSILV
jgi:hypothetical protein